MGLKPQRYFALAHRFHKATFGGMLAKQFQRPSTMALRRRCACQSDDLLLLSRCKGGATAGSRGIEQRPFQSLGTKPLAHIADRAFPAPQLLDDLFIREAFVGLQQNLGSPDHAHGSRARPHQTLQMLPCLVREANEMFLHAAAYTSGINFREDVLGLNQAKPERLDWLVFASSGGEASSGERGVAFERG